MRGWVLDRDPHNNSNSLEKGMKMDRFEHLPSLGFAVTSTNDGIKITFPDGTKAQPCAYDRLRQLSGRMDNLRYMARAMDHYDNVENPPEGSAQGDKQFEHLLTHHQAAALIYFALRRLQRAGNLAELRRGLTLLLAYDHGELSATDALTALWPSDSVTPSSLPTLPISVPALAAA